MNIYDFDNTIYNGDSSIDFYKYCLKKYKNLIILVPKTIFALMLYLLKIKEKEYFKSVFFEFVKYIDVDKEVDLFWQENKNKIKDFYIRKKKDSDIIISASPEFLLKPITKDFNIQLIATKVDKKTGHIIGNNCYGIEKVNRLKKINIQKCNEFYSDSLSDEPLSKIAKKAYIVNGSNIINWQDYKDSNLKKLKKLFFNRDFITFVAIGIINVFNGVFIAYIYSLFIKNAIIAYILGFFTSLCIAYCLNAILNFKQKLSFKNLYKYALNNIPNFIIQIFSVVVLIQILEVPKIISYFISAVIAVPITFLLVKSNVFK